MKYRLVEENELRRLIESDMIYDELCAQGVNNWIGCDFVHYPDIDEIEKKINKYNWIGCDFVHYPDIDEIEKK